MKIQGSLREGGAFILIGGLATAVHVATALTVAGIFKPDPLVANLAGYCAAVGTSYLGNATMTFRSRVLHGPQFVRFVVVSLAGLMLNQALVYVLTHLLGWPFAYALAPVVVLVPIFTFVLSKFWAFGAREGSERSSA